MAVSGDVTLSDGARLHPYIVALVRWCVSCLWSTATVLLHRLMTSSLTLPAITGKSPVLKPRPAGKEHLDPEPKVECVVLHQPTTHNLDVIFVHGLYGSLGNTWRQGEWRSKYPVDPERIHLRRPTSTPMPCTCPSCDTNTNNDTQNNENKETDFTEIRNNGTFTDENEFDEIGNNDYEDMEEVFISNIKRIIPKDEVFITEKFYNNTLLDQVEIVDNYDTRAQFVSDLFKNCDNESEDGIGEIRSNGNGCNDCDCSRNNGMSHENCRCKMKNLFKNCDNESDDGIGEIRNNGKGDNDCGCSRNNGIYHDLDCRCKMSDLSKNCDIKSDNGIGEIRNNGNGSNDCGCSRNNGRNHELNCRCKERNLFKNCDNQSDDEIGEIRNNENKSNDCGCGGNNGMNHENCRCRVNEKRCEVGCGCICDECYSPCWPKDWLQVDFPDARVISINYTSDPHLWRPLWIKESKRLKLHERAEQMMDQLLELGVGRRPIVWVGHSKGGLFIKQIYCEAYEAHKKQNNETSDVQLQEYNQDNMTNFDIENSQHALDDGDVAINDSFNDEECKEVTIYDSSLNSEQCTSEIRVNGIISQDSFNHGEVAINDSFNSKQCNSEIRVNGIIGQDSFNHGEVAINDSFNGEECKTEIRVNGIISQHASNDGKVANNDSFNGKQCNSEIKPDGNISKHAPNDKETTIKDSFNEKCTSEIRVNAIIGQNTLDDGKNTVNDSFNNVQCNSEIRVNGSTNQHTFDDGKVTVNESSFNSAKCTSEISVNGIIGQDSFNHGEVAINDSFNSKQCNSEIRINGNKNNENDLKDLNDEVNDCNNEIRDLDDFNSELKDANDLRNDDSVNNFEEPLKSSDKEDDRLEVPDRSTLWTNSVAFMFYSVPHRGSPLADIKTPVTARSVELQEIAKDCSLVLSLQQRWLDATSTRQPLVRSLVETKRTLMSVLWLRIVSTDSADPGIGALCGVSVDHREICKPSSRQCLLYTELTKLIKAALLRRRSE